MGEYKRFPNEVGGKMTAPPEKTEEEIKALLKGYHSVQAKTLEDIVEFHLRFESIHPFQDGNSRQ